jgi:hypothetical protein
MMRTETSRPEGAFVLMLVQATLWIVTAISAAPFGLAGEPFMPLLGMATLLLALIATVLGLGLVFRWRRARRWAITLEATCLAGSLLLLLAPIGANHGPVSLLVNVALPATVIWLLRGKRMRAYFAA